MTGRKLLSAVSLRLPGLLPGLSPVYAHSADIKTQPSTRYLWYAAQLLYDAPGELDNGASSGSVPFSGKAALSR
jgi:hypothetical protein